MIKSFFFVNIFEFVLDNVFSILSVLFSFLIYKTINYLFKKSEIKFNKKAKL